MYQQEGGAKDKKDKGDAESKGGKKKLIKGAFFPE